MSISRIFSNFCSIVLLLTFSVGVQAKIPKDLKYVLKGQKHHKFFNVKVKPIDQLETQNDIDTFVMFLGACSAIENYLIFFNSEKIFDWTDDELEARTDVVRTHKLGKATYILLWEVSDNYIAKTERFEELRLDAIMMMESSIRKYYYSIWKKYKTPNEQYLKMRGFSEYCLSQFISSRDVLKNKLEKYNLNIKQ